MIHTDGTPTIAMTDGPLGDLIRIDDYFKSIHTAMNVITYVDGNVYVNLDEVRDLAGKFFEDLANIVDAAISR